MLCWKKYEKAQKLHAFVTKLWWKHDSCKNICIFLIYPKLLKNKFVLQIWTNINSIRYFNNFWSLFQVVISVNKHSIFIKWYPFGNHLKDLDALKNNKFVFWWCIFNFVDACVPELNVDDHCEWSHCLFARRELSNVWSQKQVLNMLHHIFVTFSWQCDTTINLITHSLHDASSCLSDFIT